MSDFTRNGNLSTKIYAVEQTLYDFEHETINMASVVGSLAEPHVFEYTCTAPMRLVSSRFDITGPTFNDPILFGPSEALENGFEVDFVIDENVVSIWDRPVQSNSQFEGVSESVLKNVHEWADDTVSYRIIPAGLIILDTGDSIRVLVQDDISLKRIAFMRAQVRLELI